MKTALDTSVVLDVLTADQAVGTRLGLLDRRLDLKQEADHRAGPNLLVLLLHEGEFAQMGGISPPSFAFASCGAA